MKATMESTGKLVIINGMNFRVWEGVSGKGVRFVALVNRLEAVDPPQQTQFIGETMEKHKDLDASSKEPLERLGVV